jgi:arsenate reductase
MKIQYEFSSKIWQYKRKGGWIFISLPQELSREIKEIFKSEEDGWGRLKSYAQIGNTEWQAAIWFDPKSNTYLLPLKAEVRKKEKIKINQIVNITINMKKKILVLCTGNSCRSQIAEGYLRYFVGEGVEIYSAGVETHGVNPKAIAIMKEDGIDISHQTSNNIDEYFDIPFDYVITVCDNAKERCPFFPTKARKFHQNFPDPAKATGTEEEILNEFRKVREQIKTYCKEFVESNNL